MVFVGFDKVGEVAVAVNNLLVGVGDEEEDALRHLDLDVLLDNSEIILALLDFLVKEVENGNLKSLIQVLEVSAKLIILIKV
jgi:hypothetical protein